MKRFFLLAFILLPFFPLTAQYVPGVDWKRIKTDHFLVIFPAEIEEDARRAALLAEGYYGLNLFKGTRHPFRRWPLVLTNRGMEPNAYVSPYQQKTVWYGTPFTEGGITEDWYTLLAVHEGRHIAQFERLNRGLIRLGYLLSGNGALSLASTLTIPEWFFEGDAVDRETMLSSSGRGRDPVFARDMEAIIAEAEGFNYYKLMNGSFRHHIPSHYHLGYPLTAYTRSRYGEESWDKILSGPTWLPLPLAGIVLGSITATKQTPHALYGEMVAQWAAERREQQKDETYTAATALTPENRCYTRYDALHQTPEGDLIARRWSLDAPARLVKITDKEEIPLERVSPHGRISLAGDLMVVPDYTPHIRYESFGYSNLAVTNRRTGERRRLTRQGRFIDPVFDEKGKTIAAVEWNRQRRAALVLLSPETGEELKRIPLPPGLMGSWPVFSPDGNRIALVLQGAEGRALGEIDLTLPDSPLRILIPFSSETIKRPAYSPRGLLFSSNYGGREALYLITDRGGRELAAQRPYTAMSPLMGRDGRTLYYVDYTGLTGERIVSAPLPAPNSLPLPDGRLGTIVAAPFGERAEETSAVSPPAPTADEMAALEVKSYAPAAHLFRIIGWTPAAEGIGESPIESISLGIISQDVLETLTLEARASYYPGERTFGGEISAEIKSLFPLISLGGNYRQRKPEGEEFQEANFGAILSLPLNLSRGLWQSGAIPSAGFSGRLRFSDGDSAEQTLPVQYGLTAYHLLYGSRRDLLPDLGVTLTLGAIHTPFDDGSEYLLSGLASFFLPGPLKSTGFQVQAGWERQNSNYVSLLPGAKGWDTLSGEELLFTGADFRFPLLYPDLPLGPFAYIKRIRGALFGHNTRRRDEHFTSLGAEVETDLTLLGIPIPLSAGFRASYLVQSGTMEYQILVMSSALP